MVHADRALQTPLQVIKYDLAKAVEPPCAYPAPLETMFRRRGGSTKLQAARRVALRCTASEMLKKRFLRRGEAKSGQF